MTPCARLLNVVTISSSRARVICYEGTDASKVRAFLRKVNLFILDRDRHRESARATYSYEVFIKADRDGSNRSFNGRMAAPMAGASAAIAARSTGAMAGTSPARLRKR